MLLLAGFTLGFAYMGWSSYRLIVPCMHGRVRFRQFSSVFHAIKKAVQIFAPLEKHLKSVGIELIGSRHTVKLIFTGSDIAAEEKHIGYSRVIT